MRIFQRYLTILLLLISSAEFGYALPKANPRNVILVVGDGMGPQQIGLATLFARYTSRSEFKRSVLEEFLNQSEIGVMQSVPSGALVNDSACSITQIATASDCASESLGLDASGRKLTTILELARANRKSAGLVSDTRLTHATPAGFVAKESNRNNESSLAEQIIASGVEVLLSGGAQYFVPKSFEQQLPFKLGSKREDDKDLLEQAKKHGYQLALDRSALKGVKNGKLLGLFAESGMQDGISEWQNLGQANGEPSLAEMTAKAIQLLSQDKEGFFLMIEAGQIDWAAHNNDAGTLLHEMLRLERALKVVLDFAKNREDTLVVLTADHETGGFGFSYLSADKLVNDKDSSSEAHKVSGAHRQSLPRYNFGSPQTLDRLFDQAISFSRLFEQFDQAPRERRNAKGLTELFSANSGFNISLNDADQILATERNGNAAPELEQLLQPEWAKISDFSVFYPDMEGRRPAILARALAEQQGIVWATGTHTSTPVIVAARGSKEWSGKFDGFYSGIELGKMLKELVSNK